MMMIQIEYPALARIPLLLRRPTDRRPRARNDGPVRRTQQSRKEKEGGGERAWCMDGARALARSPTSARRPRPTSLPPSPTASANQRSAANAERRHSAATIAVVRRPKDDRRPLSPAPRRRGRRQMETQDGFDSDRQSVSQSGLVSSAEGKCLPCHRLPPLSIRQSTHTGRGRTRRAHC